MFGSIGLPELFLLFLFAWPVFVAPFWVIFSKAGFPGILSLLLVIPGINLLVLYYVAFANWPSLTARERPGAPSA